MAQQKYYYKKSDGSAYLCYKEPIESNEEISAEERETYVAITEEEWNAHIAELEAAAQEQEPAAE